MIRRERLHCWLARFPVIIVLFFNLQCALVFLFTPQNYIYGFELEGSTGEATLRGIGVLFVMWNIPYLFAAWNPLRNRLSLIESIMMQAVGVIGESFILLSLPGNHPAIQLTIRNFIGFDAAGLLLLLLAAWIIMPFHSDWLSIFLNRAKRQTTKPGH
jgi:hypothetical protein